jgi:hypothetical protein
MHAAGICPCCEPRDGCPECGGQDLSFNGPGYLADLSDGQPDTPLVCEECGWTGTEDETLNRVIV